MSDPSTARLSERSTRESTSPHLRPDSICHHRDRISPRSRVAGQVSGDDPILGTSLGRVLPFLECPAELRKLVYTTNAIESLNARFRKAVRHRGHFPNEQSAMKVLYLVATSRRPNRENMTGQISAWKQILNTLTIHYGDRINATN